MKNFYRVATNVEPSLVMQSLARQPDLWNGNRFRTTYPGTPHAAVDDILLRFSDPEKCTTTSQVIGDSEPIWLPAAFRLPQVKPIVRAVMNHIDAHSLDRLLITRLRPGARILPHADNEGEYVHDPERARYHVVLQGLPGSIYRTGDETVTMRTGEVWWFNALAEHEVVNNSEDDRVHLLMDVRTWPI